jgi:hypothetical protein
MYSSTVTGTHFVDGYLVNVCENGTQIEGICKYEVPDKCTKWMGFLG